MIDETSNKGFLNPQKVLDFIGVKPGDIVADLGCGARGYFTFLSSQVVGEHGKVIAVDIRQLVLEGLKKRARVEGIDNIQTVWADLEVYKSTGLADNSVDYAYLFSTLFQGQKRQEMLKEAMRLVKVGGFLAVVDWEAKEVPFGPSVEKHVNPEGVIEYCTQNGMELVKEFRPGSYHFGLLFKKK